MSHNIERYDNLEGWAVFSHADCDGCPRCPHLVAFCMDKTHAERIQARVFEAVLSPAFIREDGLVIANDCFVNTHDELRAALAAEAQEGKSDEQHT